MADIITKILIRQGTDVQRRTANLTGVTFSSGEPGFCVDTKRLYVGDGTTVGGNAIGIQNLGKIDGLFGSYQNGFSYNGLVSFLNKGAAVGDIIYDNVTRGLYALTSVSSFPPLSSDLAQYDFTTLVNPAQFEYDSQQRLQLKDQAVGPRNLDFTVVDNYTIGKASLNAPISLIESSVENRYLAPVAGDTVKGNFTGVEADPQDLYVYPGTFVGRTASSRLSCFPFSILLQQAEYSYTNGIVINQAVVPPVFSLDPAIFTANSSSIALRKDTSITGTLNVVGNTTVTGTLRCTNDIVAYYTPSDKRYKEDLQVISNAVAKLQNLTGYEFTYKHPGLPHIHDKRSYGIIAQDAKDVLPHAVENREPDHQGGFYLGVSYEKLVPVLIEAVKELKKEIEELKAR